MRFKQFILETPSFQDGEVAQVIRGNISATGNRKIGGPKHYSANIVKTGIVHNTPDGLRVDAIGDVKDIADAGGVIKKPRVSKNIPTIIRARKSSK